MRCRHCGKRYSAADSQPAPGGSSAPGEFFFAALLIAGLGGVFWLAGFKLLGLLTACVAILPTLLIPLAWWDCHGPVAISSHGGERCSHCGGRNKVWPWSL